MLPCLAVRYYQTSKFVYLPMGEATKLECGSWQDISSMHLKLTELVSLDV